MTNNITILLIIVGCIAFFLLTWFYYKLVHTKTELKFLLQNKLDLAKQNEILQQEKILYIQKIEQLSSKIDRSPKPANN